MLTLLPSLFALIAIAAVLLLIARSIRQAWTRLAPIHTELRAGGPFIDVRVRLIEPVWPQPVSLHSLRKPGERAGGRTAQRRSASQCAPRKEAA